MDTTTDATNAQQLFTVKALDQASVPVLSAGVMTKDSKNAVAIGLKV